jgi:hypothetical protein
MTEDVRTSRRRSLERAAMGSAGDRVLAVDAARADLVAGGVK